MKDQLNSISFVPLQVFAGIILFLLILAALRYCWHVTLGVALGGIFGGILAFFLASPLALTLEIGAGFGAVVGAILGSTRAILDAMEGGRRP